MARGSVHRERPSVGAIVFVAVVACFSAYLTQMLRFGTNWAFAWCANTIVTGLAIWLLVDLLHSRRQIVEPQSYGFAPIVAQPVQNLTTPPASN